MAKVVNSTIILIIYLIGNIAFSQTIDKEVKYISKNGLDTLFIKKDTLITKKYIVSDTQASFTMYRRDLPVEDLLLVQKFKIDANPNLSEIFKKALSRKALRKLAKSKTKPSIHVLLNTDEELAIVSITYFLDIEKPVLSANDLFKITKQIREQYKPIINSEDNSYKVFNYLIDSGELCI